MWRYSHFFDAFIYSLLVKVDIESCVAFLCAVNFTDLSEVLNCTSKYN